MADEMDIGLQQWDRLVAAQNEALTLSVRAQDTFNSVSEFVKEHKDLFDLIHQATNDPNPVLLAYMRVLDELRSIHADIQASGVDLTSDSREFQAAKPACQNALDDYTRWAAGKRRRILRSAQPKPEKDAAIQQLNDAARKMKETHGAIEDLYYKFDTQELELFGRIIDATKEFRIFEKKVMSSNYKICGTWYRPIRRAFRDYASMDSFPIPPVAVECNENAECASARQGVLFACKCQIEHMFTTLRVDLEKERAKWHPDNFEVCAEEHRAMLKEKAAEVYTVLNRMCEAKEKEAEKKEKEKERKKKQKKKQKAKKKVEAEEAQKAEWEEGA